jgi:hypothetical protein
MNINQQLHDLYCEYWGDLLSQLDDEKNEHTNPLLTCIDEEKLANADIKVMIFWPRD